ncbi:ATPase [Nakamurella sp. YIM 132087]|uniref:ATPase n=1 Tax=Nakamurella alba TaxID=2665158 RepID=A0A7K1FJ04_9ACTN|nr:SRPBCC family protein [Nakamurella alba]MTD13253.1 ATPase [Nakamurella alba]
MTATEPGISVRRSVTVPLPPQRAFDLFAVRMGAFWPRAYSIGAAPMADLVVEPGPGGRWYEVGEDGSECTWGSVLVWEPPHRIVLAWQIDDTWHYREDLVTEVEVVITADGAGGSTLDLEHRHLERMGPAGESMRAVFGGDHGWRGILAGLVTAATAP